MSSRGWNARTAQLLPVLELPCSNGTDEHVLMNAIEIVLQRS